MKSEYGPAGRRTDGSPMKWLLLVVFVALLAILLLLGVPVVRDQIRVVEPPPEDPARIVADRYGRVPHVDSGREESVPSAAVADPAEQVAGADEAASPRTDAAQALLPVGDVDRLPEPLREPGRAYNETIDRLVLDFVALALNGGAMTFEEARGEWMRIQEERFHASEDFDAAIEGLAPGPGVREEIEAAGKSTEAEWSELAWRSWLAVSVAHERWDSAAGACWALGGGDPSHDPEWWDQEMYYLRKAGPRGRAFLALRTVMPHLPVTIN